LLQAGDVLIGNLDCLIALAHHVNHVGQRLAGRSDLYLPIN
jgi:hypothetical protein